MSFQFGHAVYKDSPHLLADGGSDILPFYSHILPPSVTLHCVSSNHPFNCSIWPNSTPLVYFVVYFYLSFFSKWTHRIQLGPGQTLAVPGRIRVPHYANNVVSTLTIIVQRRTDNAISRRQVYIRTKSEVTVQFWKFLPRERKKKLLHVNIIFQPGEKWAPWCTIRTVTRCDSYLDESICASRYWNMRAEIQDTEAGI